MSVRDKGYGTIEEIATDCGLPLATVQDYAARGWFDPGDAKPGKYYRGDSVWRCGLISLLRNTWGYDDEEIDGIIRYADRAGLARMGGGRVVHRYVPFEQELSKAGPVWICLAQGAVAPDRPLPFTVHGAVEGADLDFMVVREDAMLAQDGTAETFELLGTTYARGTVQPGLRPGTYRVHLANCASYRFTVCADSKAELVELCLRYFRGTRCGEETEFHAACHLDDAIRDDTGDYYPLVGGWHDAGDFCHITSTTTASYYLARALDDLDGNDPVGTELYAEAVYGADYNLRARDPQTGKVFENKGTGVGGFEGHFGDNQRTTDNIVLSGDERHIRTTGSLQTAMDCISNLAVVARHARELGRFRERCVDAGEKSWAFHADEEETRLFQTAKRVIACLEWHRTTGNAAWLERMQPPLDRLCAGIDADGDVIDMDGRILFEHYQHGTPFLALALAVSNGIEQAREPAVRAADRLVELSHLQPYGVTCYSLTFDEHADRFTNGDTLNTWHSLGNGKSYRQYQPFTSAFWMGSISHLSVLGIGLALLGRRLAREDYTALAWRHFDWAVGTNPYQTCMVSGWGDCEAAPHSGAVGYMPGATHQGPIGDQDDVPYMQTGRGMRVGEEPLFNFSGPAWAREYWSPLSAALIWLRLLLG